MRWRWANWTIEWLEGSLGRALTEKEQRYVKWINGLDTETIQTIGGLIDQAHRFGRSGKVRTRITMNRRVY